MAAQVLTLDDLEPLRREIAELRALIAGRAGDVLSTEQAASVAGVSPKTVREWITSGRLPAGRRGRLRIVLRADLDTYLSGVTPPAAGLLSSLTPPRR